MRVIPIERTGPPSVLRVREAPDPVAGPGEVVVRVDRIGVNFAEILSRQGLYGWAPPRPYVPGMEASGEIESVGDGVESGRVGEKVIVATQYGCYAERIAVPVDQALPALAHYSMDENAAFSVNYLTAWVALFEMARLRPTDSVLITSAAGGVGSAAVQLASAFGCTVFGAVGSTDKMETVRRLGASRTFEYSSIEDEVRDATNGRGVDVALELVGAEVYRSSFQSLAPLGRVVVAGFSGRPRLQRWNPFSWLRLYRAVPRPDLMQMLERSLGVASTHIGHLFSGGGLSSTWNELAPFVERHGIRPVVGATFDFESMSDAHAYIESRRNVGKVVVRVTPGHGDASGKIANAVSA